MRLGNEKELYVDARRGIFFALSSRKVFVKADSAKGSQPAHPSDPTAPMINVPCLRIWTPHVSLAQQAWPLPLAFSHSPPPLSDAGSVCQWQPPRRWFLCPSLPDQPITMGMCLPQIFSRIMQNVRAWGTLSSQ